MLDAPPSDDLFALFGGVPINRWFSNPNQELLHVVSKLPPRVVVPEAGLEPATPYGGKILSLVCMPIPPLRHYFDRAHFRRRWLAKKTRLVSHSLGDYNTPFQLG